MLKPNFLCSDLHQEVHIIRLVGRCGCKSNLLVDDCVVLKPLYVTQTMCSTSSITAQLICSWLLLKEAVVRLASMEWHQSL